MDTLIEFLVALSKIPAIGPALVFFSILVMLAVFGPRFMNSRKEDQVEGNVLNQLQQMTEQMESLRNRVNGMDAMIHRQQIRLTRLQVLVIQMNGLLVSNGIKMPDYMQAELKELTEDDSVDA